MLVAVALGSAAMLMVPSLSAGAGSGGLSANQVVQLINREKAAVIDVSGTAEYAAGHVVGAKNVPFEELESKLPGVVKNKAIPLVLVCANGARAKRAVAVAKKLGFENTQVLAGGLGAWRAASLPIEKA